MEIQVSSRQKIQKIDGWAVKRLLKDIVNFLEVDVDNVSIVFCDDDFIRPLNAQYFGRDVVTDVISFPLVEYAEMNFVSGELLISVERAIAHSVEYEVELVDELVLYIIHGFLHLMGYEDSPDSKRKLMQKEENKILRYVKDNTNHLDDILKV